VVLTGHGLPINLTPEEARARDGVVMMVKRQFGRAATLLIASCIIALAPGWASALDEKKDEKEKLKLCERRMCDMVVKKTPATGDLSCALSKTWASKAIKEGAEGTVAAWEYGDARCTVELKLPRSLIIEALAGPKVKLEMPRHEVICEVERDKQADPVRIELAPKIEFKDGRARKIWVNVKKVEGPASIKALVHMVAKVEDTVGLFQKRMLKAANKFIQEKCPTVAAGR
jgi:hypothetical protein